MFNNYFLKPCPLFFFYNVEKHFRAGQATDDNGACTLHAGYLRLQTHTEYTILIAFPLQLWLHTRPSMLCYVMRTLAVLFSLISNILSVHFSKFKYTSRQFITVADFSGKVSLI